MTLLSLVVSAWLAAEPPPQPVCPGPVTTRALLGCDEGCRVRAQLERFLAQVPLGEVPPQPTLGLLIRHLEASRLVRAFSLTCDASDSGAKLTLAVEPIPFVRKVRVTGQDAFRRRELLKRVFLRAGTPLDVDPSRPLENDLVRRQLDSLERLYRQAGLDDARVSVVVTQAGAGLIDLELVIDEGSRTRIAAVEARHVHRGRPDPDGLACPVIEPRRLERLIGLTNGDAWTRLVERQVRERLRTAFQAAGFERPRVLVTPPTDPAGLVQITVETERCWLIRLWARDLASEGHDAPLSFRWTDPWDANRRPDSRAPYERLPLADWEKSLPFGESGTYDREEAVRGVVQLGAELSARGFPFAEVALEHRDLSRIDARRASDTEVAGTIDYLITRNLERRLQGIRFQGRSAFSEDTIFGLMKTAPYDFFGTSGAFDESRVAADLASIAAFYRDQGYFAFRFVRPRPTQPDLVLYPRGDDARPFALEKSPASAHLTLVIAFEEGPRARLASLEVKGLESLSQPELERLTGLTAGAPFSPLALRVALDTLGRHYRARGHHRLRVATACRVDGRAVACDADAIAVPSDVSLTLDVHEGPVVTVGAVVWRGNAETDPHVLTRDLPAPGEVLDFGRVNAAVRKMRALNVFNSVRVDAEGLDPASADPDVAVGPARDEALLVVAVEEVEPRFLDLALGLRSIRRANLGRVPPWVASGAGGLVGQADRATTGFGRAFPLDIPDLLFTFDFEYIDLNSQGIGNQLRIPFDAGFSLSQFLRQASFDPSYTLPRLFDTDLKLIVRGIAELDRVSDPLDRLELGLEGDLLVPLGDRMLAGFTTRVGVIQLERPEDDCVYCLTGPPVGLGTNVPMAGAENASNQAVCDGDPDSPACSDSGFRPQLTTSLRWRLDTQDTPLHPTRGVLLSAVTSFILDRDRLSSAPVFNQFVKWEASARFAFSLQSVVLAAFLRYGGAATFGERFLPADERFTLGGSNGMRGFADNGICRYDEDGGLDPECPSEFGGNVVLQGSFELRVPLLTSADLWLGAFLDVGGLARSHEELYLASMRLSSGFGVRWLIGGLFPVRLDIGFPILSRRCTGPAVDGQCPREEPSQLHFGLLYSF